MSATDKLSSRKPVRLRLSRTSGFDLQALSVATNGLRCVVVSRPSPWGNPYVIGEPVDRRQAKRWGWWPLAFPDFIAPDAAGAVRRFGACLAGDEAIHQHVADSLRGRNLACWCDLDAPCHADVLLEFVNSERMGAAA